MTELAKNPHFIRYYHTWQKNPASIVFIPLAELYREQGQLDEAREVCVKGLEQHPGSIGGRLTLARIEYDGERMEESRRLLKKILEEIPGQREARALLQRIEAASPEAVPPETEVSPLPPGEETPLFETCTMAEIYASQGEMRAAVQIIRRILARDPSHTRAKELETKWSAS